ncbi:MAG: c-type cytochrome [Bryobacterales bacterium]|nr:c-type cytochrome [Bryobacterales bacterium]
MTKRIGVLSLVFLWFPAATRAQSAADDYKKSCAMCHTIGGGPLAGPDLAGMSDRRERSWLIRFIVDPQAVVGSGDTTAKAMVDEYKGMIMPALPGMTHERAAALVDYVRERSSGKSDQPASSPKREMNPVTAEDVERGRELFVGVQPLEAHGAACLACHDTKGLESMGGGRLGPNLTSVYERLGGRQGLESWLSAPPTPLMSSLYRTRPLSAREITAFIAFFEARPPREAVSTGMRHGAFSMLGLLGTGLLLGVFHLLWRGRRRGVRAKLVQAYRLRGVQ